MEAHAANSLAEVREVLDKYLELFQQNSSIDFKYHLAPNSVVDWYGRTVRGANKIHDYLRHEVINQYEHVEFLEPEACSPIETKTSHMRTKVISTKPIDHVHPINRLPDMVPLKSYADSDVEDNDHLPISSSRLLHVAGGLKQTPEKCTSTLTLADLTPPSSAVKEKESCSRETDEETGGNNNDDDSKVTRRQRLKRTHTGHFSYLKRLPTAPSTSKRAKDVAGGIRTLLDDSSSEEDELEVMEALYTPLRYLEVKGVIRIQPKAGGGKQRSALWRDRSQLETRIRISYRRKLEDNQLQFALIIYESLNAAVPTTPTRRNLMSHFSLTVDEAESASATLEGQQIEETVIEPILTVPAMTVMTPESTNLFGSEEDPLQEESSLEALSVANLRTPTKFTHTPPATPKRKPRSLMGTASGLKRLHNSPQQAPTPKRSAARSLRL
ncbi:uncharacterized protein LOC106088660 [Stomoxys calcitrans]|uniref:uncharacterized protein LOC106088660 n=1 Tax=Stomoxys calcitrans TaxID=35570 RepID=UPI0027E31BD2|nr:uncharacterized protein LOC106088660 [Stomoxys calcitrans]